MYENVNKWEENPLVSFIMYNINLLIASKTRRLLTKKKQNRRALSIIKMLHLLAHKMKIYNFGNKMKNLICVTPGNFYQMKEIYWLSSKLRLNLRHEHIF